MRDSHKIDLLRALEMFLAAANGGSMTKAARQLKVTQSAISQQLKLLEREMRVRLMDRDNRPLRLTPAGNALRQHAADLLLHAEEVRSDVRQFAVAGLTPVLRIAMFGTLAKTLAPALMSAVVQKKLPIRTVSILRGMALQHANDLPRREVDIIISSNALMDVDGMERYELIYERFLLVAPKGLVSRQDGLREIATKLPMIRYSSRTEAGRLIEQHLRRLRLQIPVGHTFDAPEDLFAMVAMGQGWAITPPTHVVHATQPASALDLRAIPGPAVGRRIMLVARKNELGDLPKKVAMLCRQVLVRDYIPRVQELMPKLADHLEVLDDGNNTTKSDS